MSKRDSTILELLTAQGKLEVAYLSDRLGVSEVTVRKDLDALQAKGLVLRQHGFVTLASPNDVSGRLAYHYEEKRRIARAAAELVPDGSTVMIESGSCCALLARELADTKQGVSIVTNSAFIASYVRDSTRVTCTLLGGTYQRDSQVMVGPLVRTCAANEVVVLTESEKFGQRGAIPMRLPGKTVSVITDGQIGEDWLRRLADAGVGITIAS